ETSLLVPLALGGPSFQERVNASLGLGRRYTTDFVRMEFRRVVMLRLAQFCIQLHLPNVRTVDDLLADWLNHFGDRDAKFMGMVCRQLISTGIDTTSPSTKPIVFRHLAEL